ncbi:unnamed protein product, partial [Didymodactylos carnosus]
MATPQKTSLPIDNNLTIQHLVNQHNEPHTTHYDRTEATIHHNEQTTNVLSKRKLEDQTEHTNDQQSPFKTTLTPIFSTSDSHLDVPFWKKIMSNRPFFEPKEIGNFSLLNRGDTKECFEDDRYLRKYIYPLKTVDVKFDCTVGESTFELQGQNKNIDSLLWWLLRHKNEYYQNGRFTFDFLSWRGVLRLIMFTLFEKLSDYLLAIVRYKNSYFLCEFSTDLQVKQESDMTAKHRSYCYWGHKFEDYVTKEIIESSPSPMKQYTGVFYSVLDCYRLLYAAEMDCVIENKSNNDKNKVVQEHVELKICSGNSLADLPFNYNRKYAKWWLQSYLAGIKTMIIGLRDDNGFVNKIAPLEISKMENAT